MKSRLGVIDRGRRVKGDPERVWRADPGNLKVETCFLSELRSTRVSNAAEPRSRFSKCLCESVMYLDSPDSRDCTGCFCLLGAASVAVGTGAGDLERDLLRLRRIVKERRRNPPRLKPFLSP